MSHLSSQCAASTFDLFGAHSPVGAELEDRAPTRAAARMTVVGARREASMLMSVGPVTGKLFEEEERMECTGRGVEREAERISGQCTCGREIQRPRKHPTRARKAHVCVEDVGSVP